MSEDRWYRFAWSVARNDGASYVYTLREGLTVATDVPLTAEDFRTP